MHQLLLTKHWRRLCGSHSPAMTIRLKLEVVCTTTVLKGGSKR